MLDALLNWILDAIEQGLELLPAWSPNLPGLGGLANPLAQINWLIAVDMPFSVAFAMLLLGPAFLLTTLTLFVVGLFTPSSTTR
jgi:hypothetical protein